MTLITYLTRVHFADGVLEEALWSELKVNHKSRPLIVTDPSLCRQRHGGADSGKPAGSHIV